MSNAFRPAAWVCYLVISILSMLVVCFAAINLEPWVPVGHFLTNSLQTIGFWFQIPRLGQWLYGNFVLIISGSLWASTQLVEIIPAIYDFSMPEGTMEPALVSLLRRWRIFAYTLETFACLHRYPIYGNGFEDLVRDRWDWTIGRFNFEEIVTIIITIMFVESLVVAIAALITIALGKVPSMIEGDYYD